MKNNIKAEIEILKQGVQEIIAVLDNDGLNRMPDKAAVLSVKDDKGVLDARTYAIQTAKDMIFDVQEKSEASQINNNRWVINSLKEVKKKSIETKRILADIIKQSSVDVSEHKDFDPKMFIDNKLKATRQSKEILDVVRDIDELFDSKDENGAISIKRRGDFTASWPEEMAKKAASKKELRGYRRDIDAVVICPRGTIGDIIDIEGLKIALPKDEGKYINGNVKHKKKQFWKRESEPKGLTPETQDMFTEYIEEQYRRKEEGVWFLNNGEPTYITGAHWFVLQHCMTEAEGDEIHEIGYFHYVEAQAKLMYFLEACLVDDRCLGLMYVKTRRTGASHMFMGKLLEDSITSIKKNYGITSKTEDDAKKVFQNMFVRMFVNLPFYLKPIHANRAPKTIVEYRPPSKRVTKHNKDEVEEYEALDTEITFKAPKDSSYDSMALKIYFGDEFSKWDKPGNILKHWEMVRRTMTEGAKIKGKAFLFSTVEKVTGIENMDDPDAESGDRFKYLYDRSNPRERNDFGRTKSGLYRIFISCYDNFAGYIDLYGKPVVEDPKEPVMGVDGKMIERGVKSFLESEAAGFKTEAERYDYWRKNPRTIEEAFRVCTDANGFNMVKLTAQREYNESLDENRRPIRGNFEFVGGVTPASPHEAVVEFVPREDGRFLQSWIPGEQHQNRKMVRGNLVMPANGYAGAFGCDPYHVSIVKSGGSKGAIHGMTTAGNPIGPSNKMFLEYIDRPRNLDVFTWDVIKACIFYGMPVLMENNVTDSLIKMKEWGYLGYSMTRKDIHPKKMTSTEKEYGGINCNNPDTIEQLTNIVDWYIDNFIGGNTDDTLCSMPFNRTINDWQEFNPKQRTKYDATVSSSIAIFATRRAYGKRPPSESNDTEIDQRETGSIFKTYKLNRYNFRKNG